MNSYTDYDLKIEEIHHVHKLDSPSGTAISIATQALENIERKQKWVNAPTENKSELEIISKRIDEVPGTHTVNYTSAIDEISITHIAHSRKGFALGAIIAAEWVKDKKGVFGMDDLMVNL
jgi:4-hydroxy-tetrahydrodipicolinate reductase